MVSNSNKAMNNDLKSKLIITLLYEQFEGKRQLQKTDVDDKNIYIKLYFKGIKKSIKINKVFGEESIDNIKILSNTKNKKNIVINDDDELAFVLNMIEYVIVFSVPYFTIIECLEVVKNKMNQLDQNNFYQNPLNKVLLDHYFIKASLLSKTLSRKQCLNFINCQLKNMNLNDPFQKYLFYLNLSIYIMDDEQKNDIIHINEISVRDLYLYIDYSLRRLDLKLVWKYISIIHKRNNSNEPYSIDFNYRLNAASLIGIHQHRIILNKNKMIVDYITEYCIKQEDATIKNLISKLEHYPNENNYLILKNKQIESGNQHILEKIQMHYLTPLRIFELLTYFYNNCLIVDGKLIEIEYQLVENLIYFILKRNKSAEWKVLFQIPLFQLILFYIIQWYIDTKYTNRRKASNFNKIIIMERLYERMIKCLTYSVFATKQHDLLFKEHSLFIKKKIGDSYYQIGNYSKAVSLFRKVLNEDQKNWRIQLKIAICYFKSYDFKQAKLNLDISLVQMTKKHREKYAIFINSMVNYLNLFEKNG